MLETLPKEGGKCQRITPSYNCRERESHSLTRKPENPFETPFAPSPFSSAS